MKKISLIIAAMGMLVVGITANAADMKMGNMSTTPAAMQMMGTTDSAMQMGTMTTGSGMKMDMCKCMDMGAMTTGSGMKMDMCKDMMSKMGNMGGVTTGSAMGMGGMMKADKMGAKENPMEILKVRLAKGEITKAQYDELKKVLTEDNKKEPKDNKEMNMKK